MEFGIFPTSACELWPSDNYWILGLFCPGPIQGSHNIRFLLYPKNWGRRRNCSTSPTFMTFLSPSIHQVQIFCALAQRSVADVEWGEARLRAGVRLRTPHRRKRRCRRRERVRRQRREHQQVHHRVVVQLCKEWVSLISSSHLLGYLLGLYPIQSMKAIPISLTLLISSDFFNFLM